MLVFAGFLVQNLRTDDHYSYGCQALPSLWYLQAVASQHSDLGELGGSTEAAMNKMSAIKQTSLIGMNGDGCCAPYGIIFREIVSRGGF
jgi:hypothetical protein